MADEQFTILSESELAKTPFMRLVERQVQAPDGSVHARQIIERIPAVVMVAIEEVGGELVVLLERQYRSAIDSWIIELPAGRMDVEDEDPEQCAIRELKEELGVTAKNIELLTKITASPGWSNEAYTIFLATGLTYGETELDGPEEVAMEVLKVPVSKLPAMVDAGELRDAKTVIGCLLIARRYGF